MSTEELMAPEGQEDVSTSAEPLAQPEQNAPSTGTEQTAEGDTSADQGDQPEGDPADKATEEPTKKVPWFVERIARQREQIAEERRQREELAARLAALETGQRQNDDPNAPRPPVSPEQLQQMVRAEAARIAEQQAVQTRLQAFDQSGRKDFPDFVERCNTLASLGASENPAFMQAITSPELEDGHRIVAQLADDPEKAMQILALPPIRMAAALARLSGQAPKPPPVSKAPPPVRPVNGAARVETDPEKMSTAEWMKWAEKHLPLR